MLEVFFPLASYKRDRWGWFWDLAMCIASFVSFVLVVLISYIGGNAVISLCLLLLNSIHAVDFVLAVAVSRERYGGMLRFQTLNSLFLLFGTYLTAITRLGYHIDSWYQLDEFSIWTVVAPMTILRVQFKSENLINSGELLKPVPRQLFLLALGIVCFILCASLSMLMWYNLQELHTLNFDESFYFVLVTISTVGFGDYTFGKTFYGRVAVVMLIITTILYVPNKLNKMRLIVQAHPQFFQRKVNAKISGHAIVTGNVDNLASVALFLEQFYAHDVGIVDKAVIFLAKDYPDSDVTLYLSDPFFAKMVYWVKRSSHIDDLINCYGKTASAVFVLSDKKDDKPLIMQALSFQLVNPNVLTLLELSKAESKEFAFSCADVILSVQEMSMSVLALSALYPGIGTLISALMYTRNKKEFDKVLKEQPRWMRQYAEGLAMEIYSASIPNCMEGLMFHQMAAVVYKHLGVLPLFLASDIENTGSYVCQAGALMYVIATSKFDADLVKNLDVRDTSFSDNSEMLVVREEITGTEIQNVVSHCSETEYGSLEKCFNHLIVVLGDVDMSHLELFLGQLNKRCRLGQQVVFLVRKIPALETQTRLKAANEKLRLFYMVGSPLKWEDLKNALVIKAKALIFLAWREEDAIDSTNVIAANMLELYPEMIHVEVLVELIDPENFSLVRPRPVKATHLNNREVFHLSPAFACGKVFSNRIFDAMLIQTFHLPELPGVLDAMLRRLEREIVSEEFAGSPVKDIVEYYCKKNRLCVAIYVTRIPCVMVNPSPQYEVVKDDFVFII